jgi:hypothetical protein
VRLAQNPVKTVYSFGTSVTHRSSGVLGTASVAPSSASSRSSLRSSRASWPPRSQVQANPISGAPRQPVSDECLVQPRAARHQDELDHHEMGAEEPGQPAGRRERPAGHAQLREATVACPRECHQHAVLRDQREDVRRADVPGPLRSPRRRRRVGGGVGALVGFGTGTGTGRGGPGRRDRRGARLGNRRRARRPGRGSPWGSETRIRSRGGAVVLVDQPTEQVQPANIARVDRDRDRNPGFGQR